MYPFHQNNGYFNVIHADGHYESYSIIGLANAKRFWDGYNNFWYGDDVWP
jgi:hypothetical protein